MSIAGGTISSLPRQFVLYSPTERYLGLGVLRRPIVATLPLSGRYVVNIDWNERPLTDRGDYTIVVRAVSSLAFGTPARGIDGPGGEVWTFEGTAGERVLVEFADDNDLVYRLLSPDGFITNSFGDPIVETLPVSGMYQIVAQSIPDDPGIIGEGSGGTYTITVRTLN